MSSNPSAAAENPQTNPAEQNQVSFDQFLPVNITPFELSDIIIQWVQQQKLIPGQVANDLKAAPFSGIFIPGYIISFTAEIDYTAERGVDRDETVFEKDGSGNLIAVSKKVTDWSPSKGHIQKSFAKIPVLPNSFLSKQVFDQIGPWDTSEFIPYDNGVITKLLIEENFKIFDYEIPPKQATELAKDHISKEVTELITQQIGGSHQRSIELNYSISELSVIRVLYPIYSYTYTHESNNYSMAINAHTGKLYASGVPLDKARIKKALTIVGGILLALIIIIAIVITIADSIHARNVKEANLERTRPAQAQKQLEELQGLLRINPNLEMPEDPWGETIRIIRTDDYITLLSNGPDRDPDTQDDIINKRTTPAKESADAFERNAPIQAKAQLEQIYSEYLSNPDILRNLPKDPWGETIVATESGDNIIFKSSGSDKKLNTSDDISASYTSLTKINADKLAAENAEKLKEQIESTIQQINKISVEYEANPDILHQIFIDPWGQNIIVNEYDEIIVLISSGPDKIPNTADDISRSFKAVITEPEIPSQNIAANVGTDNHADNHADNPTEAPSEHSVQQENTALPDPSRLIPETILTNIGKKHYDYLILKDSKTNQPCSVVIKSGFAVLDSNLWCIPFQSTAMGAYSELSGTLPFASSLFVQNYMRRGDSFDGEKIVKKCRNIAKPSSEAQCQDFENIMTRMAQGENWLSMKDECTRPAIDDKLATYCQKLPIIK